MLLVAATILSSPAGHLQLLLSVDEVHTFHHAFLSALLIKSEISYSIQQLSVRTRLNAAARRHVSSRHCQPAQEAFLVWHQVLGDALDLKPI